MGYTHEIIHQLWDDKHGDRIEIGPDRDSLGLIEIRYYGTGDTAARVPNSSMTFTPEQLPKIIEILQTIQRSQPVKVPLGSVPR